MKNYQHTQFGWAIVLGLGAGGLAMVLAAAFRPSSVSYLLTGGIVLLVGALFSTLTIVIEEGALRASFGPGLIRKKVRLADVASVRPIPVRWWYGWGIRLTPHGWLYNVSGWKAVEITLRDGRRFCLGTDEPENLLKAIQEASV
ncbi:MAG TPA: hypothetical protein VF345_14010 [Chthoniobacterales bacterium]